MYSNIHSKMLLLILSFFSISQLAAQSKFALNPEDEIPVDDQIKVGKLSNGLTYYIRENHKPEKRAELRLAVRVGSVQEDEDQLGLAHFCEHMAFNGTKNFPKQDLVNYLESIGMKFGPEVNAYTSFDRTVYMIQVPTDKHETLEKAFQILEDWAHNVSYDDSEIDKERGVIVEEWRLGRGANERMYKKQLPVLFKDSKYADRYVIGKKEILESFTHETLKRFYKDWYRPELMAVVAVGDFDRDKIEKIIQSKFSGIASMVNPRPYDVFPILLHKETLFSVATDKEATVSSLAIYNKSKYLPEVYVKDLRSMMTERLFSQMLNLRLSEITQKPLAPFSGAGGGKGRFIGDAASFSLQAYGIKENKISQALDVLLTEYKRVQKFGFTGTEMERAKTSQLRSYEQAKNEKDKVESRPLADEYIRNFLTDEFIPGIEYEYEVHKKYLPQITLDEVNKLGQELMTDENRVILVSMPEKEGIDVPTEKDLWRIIDDVGQRTIVAYEDKVSSKQLIEKFIIPSKVTEEKYYKSIDATEWILGNGVKVVLKPTDFKNDEILMTAVSPGGISLLNDEEYAADMMANGIVVSSGIGSFTNVELQKYMTGKIARISPMLSELYEGVNGNCSVKDLETMLQLNYLYFTEPRKDSSAYLTYLAQVRTMMENQKASPERTLQDSTMVVFYLNHPRRQPFSIDKLAKINLQSSIDFYIDRFADASDFTFFFVGNFKKDELKPLVEKYLGGLPSIRRKETWRNLNIPYAKGVEKNVYKGIESKSYVQLLFSGDAKFSPENRWEMDCLREVVNIKLRENIREEKGGTYGVSVSAGIEHYPQERFVATIRFGCDPLRVEELTNAIYQQLDSLKTFGVKENYIAKVKELQRRGLETSEKENRYWLNSLSSAYLNGEDPIKIIHRGDLIDKLNSEIIQKWAKKIFDKNGAVKIVLYPEKK